jgi:hypothetical protein
MNSKQAWVQFAALALAVWALVGILRLSNASEPKEDMPNRKPGLWQIQLTIDDGSFAIPASQMCIDLSAEKRLTLAGAQMDRKACSTYLVSRQRDGTWVIHSVCRLDAYTTAKTDGVASGDFLSTYSINATGVTSGSPNSTRNGAHRVTINAKWLGSCPVGQRGGDVTSNGKTTNALQP